MIIRSSELKAVHCIVVYGKSYLSLMLYLVFILASNAFLSNVYILIVLFHEMWNANLHALGGSCC